MDFSTTMYVEQSNRLPSSGQHIIANYDDDTILVYQAYKPSIGLDAIESGRLGGSGFSFDRMSWIKPNFLWMMFRSGWGTKPNQEVTLGFRIKRSFFDKWIETGASTSNRDSNRTLKESPVLIQWDPDHAPDGTCLTRRAIQIGLRGDALKEFCNEATVNIINFSDFVNEQRPNAVQDFQDLRVPLEQVYMPKLSEVN